MLFRLDPETAHHLTFSFLKIVFRIPGVSLVCKKLFTFESKAHEKTLMGLRFPNPVGLAAGFDKDALLYRELSAFGFGFIEIGTLTPKAQEGNPKPRMFRLPADLGLINRMGFNNKGVQPAARRLKKERSNLIIGGNIGKNKVTPNEQAAEDYLLCFRALFPVVDYFVVNVSSPNTPNLRELQEKEPLKHLLNTVMTENRRMSKAKPVLLKIAPDLNQHQLDEIVEIVQECGLNGIIATNTTISRDGLQSPAEITAETGGLSGAPLRKKSDEVIRYLRNKGGKDLVIIGAGGIFTSGDARAKMEAGADLVQVYTGFIYEGPSLVKNILKNIN